MLAAEIQTGGAPGGLLGGGGNQRVGGHGGEGERGRRRAPGRRRVGGLESANAFLAHLSGRGFSAATVRAYAFDLVNLARFLSERQTRLGRGRCDGGVRLDRLAGSAPAEPGRSWRIAARTGSAAASTVNRRVAAVRASSSIW